MIAALVLLLLATSAAAHIVPVPPSTCAFDPVTIEAPASGAVGTAVPPGPSDQFRILYDPQASQAEFDMQMLAPRSFTAAGVDGTFALPGILVVDLRNSGDLVVTTSLSVVVDGVTTGVPMTLTTGLTSAAGMLVEGQPIGSDGRFALVGIAADGGLAPPLAGPLVVRLACQAVPRPDIDQFRLATRTTPLSAKLTAGVLRLRGIFAPGVMDVADFPGRPALLRASSGDLTIAAVALPSGLPARSKILFIGRSDDGHAAIGVRRLRRSGQVVFLIAAKVTSPTLPAAASGTVSVTFTYDVGGLLSRVTIPMRVRRHGALLRYP